MKMEPADPHNLATTPEAIRETVNIAFEGERSSEHLEEAERIIRQLKGVVDARADESSKHLVITFDPRQTDPPAFHEALENAGLRASPVADSDSPLAR